MPITDTYDPIGREIISPFSTSPAVEGFPKTVIAVFSAKFEELLLKRAQTSEVSAIFAGGRRYPIRAFDYNGVPLGFYTSLLGGSASGALLEEVFSKGAERVLFFGSCGALDSSLTSGHFIVPTAAYRDEGTSYHYLPPSDFVEIPTAERLAEVFTSLGISYVKTKTWTTDSFYRETDRNIARRREVGCSVVEMECASVMAVGAFRGKEVYQFLYAADCLDGNNWDKRILGHMPSDMRESILKLALETAIRL